MAISQIKKCVWLLDTITNTPGGCTYEDISSKWSCSSINECKEELSKKSFHNLITAIREIFGIDIECRRKGGYKYVIENESGLDTYGSIKRILVAAISGRNISADDKIWNERIFFSNDYRNSLLMDFLNSMYFSKKLRIGKYLYDHRQQKDDDVSTEDWETYQECKFETQGMYYREKKGWFAYGQAQKLNGEGRIVPKVFLLDKIDSVQTLDESYSMPKRFNIKETMENLTMDFDTYMSVIFDDIHDWLPFMKNES